MTDKSKGMNVGSKCTAGIFISSAVFGIAAWSLWISYILTLKIPNHPDTGNLLIATIVFSVLFVLACIVFQVTMLCRQLARNRGEKRYNYYIVRDTGTIAGRTPDKL